jgi:putative membrane protein
MSMATKVLVIIVALEHLYFLYLEMFAWTKPRTRKAFGLTEEAAQTTKVMAGNQGLYNGFLSAGLLWSLLAPPDFGKQLVLFFAGCVAVAGIYGAATVTKRVLFLQAMPALITIAVTLLT